jgi:hypothetical protein
VMSVGIHGQVFLGISIRGSIRDISRNILRFLGILGNGR